MFPIEHTDIRPKFKLTEGKTLQATVV